MIKKITQLSIAAAGFLLFSCYQAEAQEKKTDSLDKPVPLLYGSQHKKYITGAVSEIKGAEVSNVPGTNRLNSFSGRTTGFFVSQLDGLPGTEENSYQIRGFHSFNGTGRPLILINGRMDDVTMLEPNDIESVTVLKDAAAAVLSGLNSANGVLLITTKRGQPGKIRVNYNVESSFQQPTRAPKFLNAYNYALLYNEAQLNDNPAATPKYNAAALEGFRSGSDPFLYPDVDWTGTLLKKFSLQTRNNLNITGGTEQAKYYFSASYLNDNGIFNTDKNINTYNTNSNLNVLNVRANIDLDITKNLSLFTDVRSKREKRNAPGAYSDSYDETIFGALYSTPANAYPLKNADGSLGGNLTYTNNPYGMLNYSGYSNYIITSLSTFSELTYDFNSLLKGLKLRANLGFTSYAELQFSRSKTFAVYSLNAGSHPATYTRLGTDGTQGTGSGGYTARQRIFDHSATLDYDAVFGEHSIAAMLMYERQQLDNGNSTELTRNFQGPKGRISYRFKNTYLLEMVAALQGSEQYPKGNRYGFFPAVSAGWILSEEAFLKDSFISFLKIRGSYGRTGSLANGVYFDYLNAYTQGAAGVGGAAFGTVPANTQGVFQSQIGNPFITWEKSLKSNVGLDFSLFNKRFNASLDYFNEKTNDILVANAISAMYGAPIVAPIGTFKNSGFEIGAGWADKAGELQYSITATYSSAKNEVTEKAEQFRNYPWMYETGNPRGTRMGYVFDRFYTETDNFASLPDQSSLGTQRPGDLKYKDLNGDNVIDNNDIMAIGYAKIPEVNYGANLGLKYKWLDLNVFFQGTARGTTYNSGATYNEFTNSGRGNVLEHHLQRWTPGSGQSAAYPRLTLNNTNNFVQNSYWLRDNSFLRLKYVELGYMLPAGVLNKIGISTARLFVNGNNVFLWDKVKQKDPEAQDNGLSYPLQRSFSVGLNVKF
ncbi:TonB-linked SusC/RagA family outer membrane protein [Pedobacter africanus]|uniref:TonB-linked SusC/RagA family outer membrane protein n=1 Tax=Pedobacter africanus TaxID=151894 RepID=A0ACC6L1X6_9SPHI|nr:TonB-dependent receptor [Pedobacter africanus]MDR6785341.1 TonB-linked SusC/RagA family outer membrane protein [Pedobacter africanus]